MKDFEVFVLLSDNAVVKNYKCEQFAKTNFYGWNKHLKFSRPSVGPCPKYLQQLPLPVIET